ncbi:MAG: tetratricopeptide repeat protein [Alphaproteobacteria bacterium]
MAESAAARDDDDPRALVTRGVAAARAGRMAEALALLARATEAAPDDAVAWNNLAIARQRSGDIDGALVASARAVALRDDYTDAWHNHGAALYAADRLEDAARAFRRVLDLAPDRAGAALALGTALARIPDDAGAIAAFERVRALRPDDAEAWLDEAWVRLAGGDFARGLDLLEWRQRVPGYAATAARYAGPQWRGGPLAGRTLLVHAEQGLGDTIQFCRYLPLLAPLDGRLVVEAPAPLLRLLASLGGGLDLRPAEGPRTEADLFCPLMSLPLVFGTCLDSIPGAAPYLAADPAAMSRFRARRDGGGLWAALVPAGNAGHSDDRRRSASPEVLAPLLAVPGVRWVNIVPGTAAPEGVADWSDAIGDFADTAAAMAALDLVVSVDTAAAHLAGALARPLWLLLPHAAEWRWLRERLDSPWYPTARLFRQARPGDWAGVARAAAAELAAAVSGARDALAPPQDAARPRARLAIAAKG